MENFLYFIVIGTMLYFGYAIFRYDSLLTMLTKSAKMAVVMSGVSLVVTVVTDTIKGDPFDFLKFILILFTVVVTVIAVSNFHYSEDEYGLEEGHRWHVFMTVFMMLIAAGFYFAFYQEMSGTDKSRVGREEAMVVVEDAWTDKEWSEEELNAFEVITPAFYHREMFDLLHKMENDPDSKTLNHTYRTYLERLGVK